MASVPRSRLVVVPGATHLSNLDRPIAFSGVVARFTRLVAGLPTVAEGPRQKASRRFGG